MRAARVDVARDKLTRLVFMGCVRSPRLYKTKQPVRTNLTYLNVFIDFDQAVTYVEVAAAVVSFVAANLHFRASGRRWTLPTKFHLTHLAFSASYAICHFVNTLMDSICRCGRRLLG